MRCCSSAGRRDLDGQAAEAEAVELEGAPVEVGVELLGDLDDEGRGGGGRDVLEVDDVGQRGRRRDEPLVAEAGQTGDEVRVGGVFLGCVGLGFEFGSDDRGGVVADNKVAA